LNSILNVRIDFQYLSNYNCTIGCPFLIPAKAQIIINIFGNVRWIKFTFVRVIVLLNMIA